ncbi:hypothetical protein [Algoriphagus winogradskyi]|nr:hypothetical protein [Algoriphagus winogradskyi]
MNGLLNHLTKIEGACHTTKIRLMGEANSYSYENQDDQRTTV